MALYCIGDLQGCHEPLQRLVQAIDFSPSRDTLYVLGDLVNRGPASLAVLRTLRQFGDAAQCLLGNHDLHLLASAAGVRAPHRSDTVRDVLNAPDKDACLDWLRHRSMALHAHGWLMVHAGVLPGWTLPQTLALAGEVEAALRGSDHLHFLTHMYGSSPDHWDDALQSTDRFRVVVNALTRLRFCTPEGRMEFASKGSEEAAPPGYLPWFAVPGRKTAGTPIAFGHWSTLGLDPGHALPGLRHNTLGLDTGCVWGGRLTAASLGALPGAFELVSVACESEQRPEIVPPVVQAAVLKVPGG